MQNKFVYLSKCHFALAFFVGFFVTLLVWKEMRAYSTKVGVFKDMTLRHVVVVARHGVRATHVIDPKVNKPTDYPMGLKELTKAGRQQAFQFGGYLREYYANHLTDNTFEVYARACFLRRCYDTVALMLAAMYPPRRGFVWNDNLSWQPVPIFHFPREHDLDGYECNAHVASSFVHLFNESGPSGFDTIGDFIRYICRKTGYHSHGTKFYLPIIDNYYLRKWDGLRIPEWAEEYWNAFEWALKRLSYVFSGEVMATDAQLLMNLIADRLEKGSAFSSLKLSLLGYHRKNFQGFLSTFGFDLVKHFPSFLASFSFELYQHDVSGNFFVRVLYSEGFQFNGGYRALHPIEIPGCEWPCELETLTEILRNVNKNKTAKCFAEAKALCMV